MSASHASSQSESLALVLLWAEVKHHLSLKALCTDMYWLINTSVCAAGVLLELDRPQYPANTLLRLLPKSICIDFNIHLYASIDVNEMYGIKSHWTQSITVLHAEHAHHICLLSYLILVTNLLFYHSLVVLNTTQIYEFPSNIHLYNTLVGTVGVEFTHAQQPEETL